MGILIDPNIGSSLSSASPLNFFLNSVPLKKPLSKSTHISIDLKFPESIHLFIRPVILNINLNLLYPHSCASI